MNARIWTTALVVVSGLCGGCVTTAPPTNYSSRVVPNADAAAVFDAGGEILVEQFGRLAESDAVARKAVTIASEFDTRREGGTGRDLYRNATRLRRSATLLVDSREDGVFARIRVDIERKETGRASQLQRPTGRFSDYPGDETAGERDASTSDEQNTVWVKTRRDTQLENSLLAQLVRRFSPTGDAATPPTRSTLKPNDPRINPRTASAKPAQPRTAEDSPSGAGSAPMQPMTPKNP